MEETQIGPPRSFPIESLEKLRDRSYFKSANFEFNRASVPLLRRTATSREKRPRLLACHDLKGGYLDDQWIQGSRNPEAYTLTHWRLLDSFVYFSHKLVTIPPPTWTNAAHRHGVQVLGTFITEWDDGAKLCKEQLLASKESSRMYAERLAELAEALGFDGWLINIENKIARDQVPNLIEFVRHLTSSMHSLVPESLVIWYDSVTTDGNLDWQDLLNEKNKPFFDVCDGIFTNYFWRADYPKLSASAAGPDRVYDVYMGVDVFPGRGDKPGGGFQSDSALTATRDAGVSAALFAPGWSYECDEDQIRWWDTIENCWPAARPDLIQMPFFTDFDVGRGMAKYINAKEVSDLPWNNLSCQNVQPRLRVKAESGVTACQLEVTTSQEFAVYSGGVCIKAESGVTACQLEVTTSQEFAVYSGGVCIKAVGDLSGDEVSIVQLYHADAMFEESSLNVSYSDMADTADSNFCLALSAEDRKGSKVIYFLLDLEDTADPHSLPRSHCFTHVSAVFEHVKRQNSATGSSSSIEGGDAESAESFKLESVVESSRKWIVRDFMLEWGDKRLTGIFGVCSAAKNLQPVLMKLLHENEALFDGETYVKHGQRRSIEETERKDAMLGYCIRLGHISMVPTNHVHATSSNPEFEGCNPSWLVGDGGDKFLSLKLRWEVPKGQSELGTWTSYAYHLNGTVGHADEDLTPALAYLGVTILSSFYVYMLPLPKSASSVTFNLSRQCACGKVLPINTGTYTLPVPSHGSGHYVRTQPSPSDWLFKGLQ